MDIKEICLLIAQLKKENETNSPEEKEFNLKWIEALKGSIDKSVNKNKKDQVMKAIVENPLNVNHSPVAISLYVNMLNKIVQCNDEKELREAMKFISMDYPVTFNSLFDYGFGRDYMWVRERENCKPLLLVEF